MPSFDFARNLCKQADAKTKCDGAVYESLRSFQHIISEAIVSHRMKRNRDSRCSFVELLCSHQSFQYNLNFHSLHFSDFNAKLKLSRLITDIKSSLKLKKVPKCSRLFSLITLQESKIFSLIFELLFEKNEFELAKLAAFWSLRKILKYDRNFSDVARSFTNVLKIVFYTGGVEKFLWMQSAALVQVNWALFIDGLDLDGLRCVIKLYHALMKCQ